LHDTHGLIIDLRENGGGAAFSAAQMASYLFSNQTSLGTFTARTGKVTEPKTQPVDRLTYTGQVIVLISEQSGSGAEVFAATLQEQGRVSVVGRPSCGCVLGINRRHALPDGGALDVSEVDYHTSKGTRLEGVGVIPNYVTDMHIPDLLAGRDTAMEAALAKLHEIIYVDANPPDGR
jgi:carboxyl-terminal processing protease